MKLAFRMAARSVWDNWRHSMATLSSIGLGLCGVALLQGYLLECEKQFGELYEKKNMYGQILVEAVQKGDDPVLLEGKKADATFAVLKSFQDQVENTVRFMPIEGIVAGKSNSFNYVGYAYDVQEGEKVRGERWAWDTLYGSPLGRSEKNQILVGRGLAELLGCKYKGQKIQYLSDGRFVPNKSKLNCFGESFQLTGLTVKGQVNAWDAEISGIIDAGLRELDDIWLLMPIQDAQAFYAGSQYSMIGLNVKDGVDPEALAQSIQAKMQEKNLDVDVRIWQRHRLAELYHTNMLLLGILRNFILLIVIMVGALSMVNTITRNIMERTREIGSLRAIGYEQGFIVRLFGFEGLFLGVLGSLAGVFLVILMTLGINLAGITYLTPFTTQPIPFRIAFTAETYLLLAFLLSTCAGSIAAVIARMRTRQSIAEALIS